MPEQRNTPPDTPPPGKARSVHPDGRPDGFTPPDVYAVQVLEGGYTRLRISCDFDRLPALHRDLVALLTPPLKLLYVQLTDRRTGQLPKPRHLVGVDLSTRQVLDALDECADLVYRDGRHQLWVRGSAPGEQVVLEEIGLIYAYPDDPLTRQRCEAHGLRRDDAAPTMAERDYVMVGFEPAADAQETKLIWSLALREWEG